MSTPATQIILAIDDSPPILKQISVALSDGSCYDLRMAKDPDAAFTILKRLHAEGKTVNLIICDILMPNMDGMTFRQKILENDATAKVPFIFITSHSSPGVISQALEVGCIDFVVKPFQNESLRQRVKAALRNAG
ncbi:MAG: response regulator [Planctomycetota bacterium]|jgi:PleD family two-component response regulator|nr:response regulator [Planctomycetota bacterium]